MTVIVPEPDTPQDDAVVDESIRLAGAAEGAAAVHEESAEEAADAARMAAELAASAVNEVAEARTSAEDAASVAAGAATESQLTASEIAQALQQQAIAIESLTQALKAGQQTPPVKETAKPKSSDKPPAQKKSHWYYGGR